LDILKGPKQEGNDSSNCGPFAAWVLGALKQGRVVTEESVMKQGRVVTERSIMKPLEVIDPLEGRMQLCHSLKAQTRTGRRTAVAGMDNAVPSGTSQSTPSPDRSGEKSPATTNLHYDNDSGKKDTAANVGHVSSQINAADESIGTKQTASVAVGEAPVDAKDSQTEAVPTLAQESAGTGDGHAIPTSVADTDVGGNATSGGEALSFKSNFWEEAGIDWHNNPPDPFMTNKLFDEDFDDLFPDVPKLS